MNDYLFDFGGFEYLTVGHRSLLNIDKNQLNHIVKVGY